MRQTRCAQAVLAILLTLSATISLPATGATTPYIPTEGESWSKPGLTVTITPSTGAPWFKDSYTSDVSIAVRRWGQALGVFADTYGFTYLRQFQFSIYVTGTNRTASPDITISFVQSDPMFVGVTKFAPTPDNLFQTPVTTQLASFDSSNTRQLTDVDMTNVALHEFGHALGLNHASNRSTNDGFLELMFRDYGEAIGGPNNFLLEPSTLDIYALATVYGWLATSAGTSTGPPVSTVVLPANIAYTPVVPYPDQISSLKSQVDQLNLRILVLAILLAVFFVVAVALGIVLSRRKSVSAFPTTYPVQESPAPSPVTGEPKRVTGRP